MYPYNNTQKRRSKVERKKKRTERCDKGAIKGQERDKRWIREVTERRKRGEREGKERGKRGERGG